MAAVITGLKPAILAPAPRARKLRVGLFADAREQARWIVEAFDKVVASDFAELVLVAAGNAPVRESALWRWYGRLDGWAFGGESSDRVDLEALKRVEHLQLQGNNPEPDLLKHQLDVVFVLGALDDALFDGVARYGVWRFCFGADGAGSAAAAGWREVAAGLPVSASGLTVRTGAGAPPRLAYQSWSRTYPLSAARNRAQLLAKTSEFLWRALRELHQSGDRWLEQCRPVSEPNHAPGPTNAEVLKGLAGLGGRILQRGVQKALSVDQWSLAWRLRSSRFGDASAVTADLRDYTRVLPPRDRDWADPFAIEKNGRYFVFFEELPYAAGKAHICMVEVKRDGSYSAPVRVLERDYHLSYPHLIEEGGELYLIPESARHRSVEVYRCVDFPLRWKLERTLLEGPRLVDATFHRGADRWWMFANAAPSHSRVYDDELHLFHAEHLLGDWQPHARNPVKSDARSSRPAGHLFLRNGTLYRPAQVCVPRYGAGLSINRVLELTPQSYREHEVERIVPDGDLLGLHTINRAGDLTVVDVFSRRSRLA